MVAVSSIRVIQYELDLLLYTSLIGKKIHVNNNPSSYWILNAQFTVLLCTLMQSALTNVTSYLRKLKKVESVIFLQHLSA
jgi:hypothetical protein